MKSKKFIPNGYSKMMIMRNNRDGISSGNYNYRTRSDLAFRPLPLNRKFLFRTHIRLHKLGSHSPDKIQIKWRKVEWLFYLRHFGVPGKSSGRYANTWTCHSWL